MKKCALFLLVLGFQSVYGMQSVKRSDVSDLWDYPDTHPHAEKFVRALCEYNWLQTERRKEAGSPAVTALQLLEYDNRQRAASAISRTPSVSPRESASPASSPISDISGRAATPAAIVAGFAPYSKARQVSAIPMKRSVTPEASTQESSSLPRSGLSDYGQLSSSSSSSSEVDFSCCGFLCGRHK